MVGYQAAYCIGPSQQVLPSQQALKVPGGGAPPTSLAQTQGDGAHGTNLGAIRAVRGYR